MNRTYDMVAEALHYLVLHQADQPGLAELAAHLGRSETHVQKSFQTFTGLTPKQFLQAMTRERALERLNAGRSVLDAALEAGLSGPGRLHDLLISTDAMTPGEARRKGKGVHVHRGTGMTPFGPALIAWTSRGITFLAFTRERGASQAAAELAQQWPDAIFAEDRSGAARRLAAVFDGAERKPLSLWLRGSPFQLKVWEALLTIPAGHHVTYGQLARNLEQPGASRAVGSAVGRNPIAWLIPCHRVITSTGALGGYRWGVSTKQAMIGLESNLA